MSFPNEPSFTISRAIGMARLILLSILVLLAGLSSPPRAGAGESLLNEPILPIPTNMPLDPEKVALGKHLFQDEGLSKGSRYSCTTCHKSKYAGTDGKTLPDMIDGKGDRNVPTIYNTGFNLAHVWDGRFPTIGDDAHATFTNARSFNSTWPEILERINGDPGYAPFLKGRSLTRGEVTSAITAYVLSLTTPDAPFDLYLRGNPDAVTEAQKKGYALFKSYGCIACHQGVNVGGNMYQKFGVMGNYFEDRGRLDKGDLGRFNVTGREEDRFVFKVPGLRLVTMTPPYFHDGSVADLEEAIRVMGRYQLGLELPDGEIRLIIDFLESLKGRYRGQPF